MIGHATHYPTSEDRSSGIIFGNFETRPTISEHALNIMKLHLDLMKSELQDH